MRLDRYRVSHDAAPMGLRFVRQLDQMQRFALTLAAAAAVAIGLGILFLLLGPPNDTNTEVGKWLLTLSSALLVAGVVSVLVRSMEFRRADREKWTDDLHVLIAARNTVGVVRLLLDAHTTARTYSEQLNELIRVRAELRRIEPPEGQDHDLRVAIREMRRYLDGLGKEYRDNYLRVARQQRLDEEWLKKRIEELATKGEARLPDYLGEALPAGQDLHNPDVLKKLADFRNEDKFDRSWFMTGYKRAKELLETKAGIRNHKV